MKSPDVRRIDALQQRRFESATKLPWRCIAFAGLLAFVGPVLVRKLLPSAMTLSAVLMTTITLIVFVLIAGSLALLGRRVWRINAIAHLPTCRYCPACGHQLQGLSAEADGCVVCPECGAAWRVRTDSPGDCANR